MPKAISEPAIPTTSYDYYLIFSSLCLLLLGLIMVASTSMNLAQTQFNQPLYYFWKQCQYSSIGVTLAIIITQIPIRFWQWINVSLLLIGITTLILVLIPSLGHEVNGSMRWLKLAGFNFQPSELIKLFMILYLSGYLVRRSDEVRSTWRGFIKPMAIVCLITSLLLLEPDYGATVVLFATVLGMLFLAGVPLRQFIIWVLVIGFALTIIILIAPYRVERLTSFVNPWTDPFNSGFQLIQSLIAIGRGELWGVGLGNSIQKLAYLPEVHTDFLFAILAEELGLMGVITIISLFTIIVLRAFTIALKIERLGYYYAAYTSYGIGLSIGLQASINLGVNMGLLPTKGLTLPLMSYGGSSMIITCIMIGLVIRIHRELIVL